MTRLPAPLQPMWPLIKRVHRLLSRVSGVVGRRTRWLQGERRLPRTGIGSSHETVAREPDSARLHPAGGAVVVDRALPAGTPADHWRFAAQSRAVLPPETCLELDGGVVVGDQGAVVTRGGTLDFESSPYFGVDDWREHPIFLRRRLPPLDDIDETVAVLATRGGGINYYHFLLDVLPRLGVLERAGLVDRVDRFFVPCGAAYQQALLEMVGLGEPDRRIDSTTDRAVRATTLLVPSIANRTELAPRSSVDWLRDRLLPTPRPPRGRRLYVSRGHQPNTRRLTCEPELRPRLEERGFEWVEPGSLTPAEQIATFAEADVVVAPHGAALTNLLWIQPGCSVLELFAPGYVNVAFWSITQAIDSVDYRYLVAPGADRFGPGSAMNAVQADIDLEPARIIDAVDHLLDGA